MPYIPSPIRSLKRHVLRKRDGEREIINRYRALHGRDLDLENPRTFSEKLYCRMVDVNRRGNPLFTRLADKLLVREHVAKHAGPEFLTPLLWSGTEPKHIPFDRLPSKCIAKTNHGSGRNIILTHPIDRAAVIDQLGGWLKENFYWAMREGHYYDIQPQVLIEGFIDDGHPTGPLDYRFWCFGGTVEMIQVDDNAHAMNAYYDRDWTRLSLRFRDRGVETDVDQPPNLKEMIEVASNLSRGIDFVRVDLYSVHGKTYAGEMTFMPTAGSFRFKPEYWEEYFGEKWKINRCTPE